MERALGYVNPKSSVNDKSEKSGQWLPKTHKNNNLLQHYLSIFLFLVLLLFWFLFPFFVLLLVFIPIIGSAIDWGLWASVWKETSKAWSCDKKAGLSKHSHWRSRDTESHKVMPLSIGNVWSGCSVENVNGTPTYSCEGGRTFPEAQTIHIALSNCDKPSSFHKPHSQDKSSHFMVYYFLEFSSNDNDCPSEAEGDARSGLAISSGNLMGFYNVIFMVLMAVNVICSWCNWLLIQCTLYEWRRRYIFMILTSQNLFAAFSFAK